MHAFLTRDEVPRAEFLDNARRDLERYAGVFIAGNIAGDVQLVIFAAAEGARAAFGINKA